MNIQHAKTMRQFVLDTVPGTNERKGTEPKTVINIRLQPQYYAHVFQDILAIYFRNTSNLLHPAQCSYNEVQVRLHNL
jgi:hypothetical protein